MIHNFTVENFYSINEEQELDFTSTKKYSSSFTEYEDKFISNVNCFIGANASGKTNVFKALHFLLWYAQMSYYDMAGSYEALFDQHKLNKNKDTKFSLTFDNNNKLYKYELVLSPKEILEETLSTKAEKGYSYLYKLKSSNGNIEITYNRYNDLSKINSNEENRFKLKKNVTFLSFLLGTGYLEKLGLKEITSSIFSNVSNVDSRSYDHVSESVYLSRALEKSEFKNDLIPYLRSFDFGIEDFAQDESFKIQFDNGTTQQIIGFKHSNNGQSFSLSAIDESAGTVKGTFLLLNLIKVLSKGGIAIIDEIDARLHYDIARKLISLFTNKETNKHNAQLFFSTHQPLFLNDRDKKQIFLCEKEDYLNTEVYRLDEIEGVRNTENFFEKYLSGTYGATPRIEDL